jgi:hypothetical protein
MLNLQKYVKSKTRVLCHVSLLDVPMIKIGRWSIQFRSYSTLYVFSFGLWWTSKESEYSDQTEIWFVQSFHLGGTYVQSFRSIAPAVTKCALLTGWLDNFESALSLRNGPHLPTTQCTCADSRILLSNAMAAAAVKKIYRLTSRFTRWAKNRILPVHIRTL